MKRGVTTIVVLVVWALAGAAVAAPGLADYAGRWGLKIDDRNLMVFDIEPGAVSSLYRPSHFMLNGDTVAQVLAPVIREPIQTLELKSDGLHVVAQNPHDANDSTEYALALTRTGAALSLAGLPTPIPLVRLGATAQVAADWDPERTYGAGDSRADNAEMTRLFDADQALRTGKGPIDWSQVAKSDAARRASASHLLAQGALRTASDFWHAAFVFQHGDKPDDYLLAHTLAMVAVEKGRKDAIWIASATLDRYLQSIGRSQIYGTQYSMPKPPAHATQEPYDRTLVSDALRTDLQVPPQARQEQIRQDFDKPPPTP